MTTRSRIWWRVRTLRARSSEALSIRGSERGTACREDESGGGEGQGATMRLGGLLPKFQAEGCYSLLVN